MWWPVGEVGWSGYSANNAKSYDFKNNQQLFTNTNENSNSISSTTAMPNQKIDLKVDPDVQLKYGS